MRAHVNATMRHRRSFVLGLFIVSLFATACGGGSSASTSQSNPLAESDQSVPATPVNAAPDEIDEPLPDEPLPVENQITQIKFLVVVTEELNTRFIDPELRVRHLINTTNDILFNNGVPLDFQLSEIVRVDYPESYGAPTALEHITFESHPAFIGIADNRDETDSDIVVLFRSYANDGQCGFAWIGGGDTEGDLSNPAAADFAYAVVAANCSDYVLLHEIGHTLGLAHSKRESLSEGSLDYGVGYGVDNVFATIMASPAIYNAPQLPVLSNPNANCDGYPCGVDQSDPANGADANTAIQQTMKQVAAYRGDQ